MLELTFGGAPYDRVAPLFDGRARVAGCDLKCVPLTPEDALARVYSTQDFDVTEMSFASHLTAAARGETHYVGIPAFVSRAFRHGAIYIRTDRGIARPQDLAHRRIGVPQYQMTAALWVRGLLSDEYGVAARDISWRTGGLDTPGGGERTPLDAPGFDIAPIPEGETLSALLAAGRLDALVASRPPACFTAGAPDVARLFADPRAVEEAYFLRTGFFPIMHMIGLRRSLAERHPWLAPALLEAFTRARDLALEQLHYAGAYYASLPWLPDDLARSGRVMAANPWSYGVPANRAGIEAASRWAVEQGLTRTAPPVARLFAAGCLD